MSNGFASLLARSDRALLGTWVKIPAPVSVELLALAGFDFVVMTWSMRRSASRWCMS